MDDKLSESESLYNELSNREEDCERLDDLVHLIFSSHASVVNNGGLEQQIEFLLENGISAKEIRNIFID